VKGRGRKQGMGGPLFWNAKYATARNVSAVATP